MMRCMTSAIAGLKAHQDAIDVVGNNIANVNTRGFKSSGISFRDSMYQSISNGSGDNTSTGKAGSNPMQIGYGATASGVVIDTTAGGQDSTGKPLDCFIDGEGYFVVADSPLDASGKATSYKYTRVGEMKFDDKGYLTDGNGGYVMQLVPAVDSTPAYLKAINFTAGATVKNEKIATDGTVTANINGTDTTIGKIAISTFSNPSGLKQIGNGYYQKSDNSGDPVDSTPDSGAAGSLVTGCLEASNVDLATEFSNMITYERGYQANTKILTVADEMLQTLVNMK